MQNSQKKYSNLEIVSKVKKELISLKESGAISNICRYSVSPKAGHFGVFVGLYPPIELQVERKTFARATNAYSIKDCHPDLHETYKIIQELVLSVGVKGKSVIIRGFECADLIEKSGRKLI